jgi:hypothetical protein
MKISKVLETVNRRKPNAVDDEDKFKWLSDLDQSIFEDIISKAEDTTIDFKSYVYDSDMEKDLIVPDHYSELYIYYLFAKIDADNEEFNSYNNFMTLYNDLFDKFAAYYRRNHIPKKVQ